MKIIEVDRLSKSFGKLSVLKELSVSLSEGDRVALVGQNGSGKTTLIRCLLGFYNFDGSVRVFGKSQRADREEILRQIAFVPQASPPLKSTVEEMCEQVQSFFDVSRPEIEACAQALDFDPAALRKQPFKKLSGGMKQKLLIALALVRKPDILVMDEPAANLDPLSRAKFYRILDGLPEKTVMLMSSHRVDELSHLVNRVVELDGGRIVMDDIMRARLSGDVEFRLGFTELPDIVEKSLRAWGFSRDENSPEEDEGWAGRVAAPDKFRFVGTLTRWSGLIRRMEMREISERKRS